MYEHHEIANIFPLFADSELEALTQDIKAHGLREAIWLYEGKILDGRNRYMACNQAGVIPSFRQYEGVDPVGFVVSLNLHRRHLNESQRGMVATNIAKLKHGGDRKSEEIKTQICALKNTTQTEAAKLLNVAERTVQHARRVQDEGAPELIEQVVRGNVAVSTASEVATLPREEQLLSVCMNERKRRQLAGLMDHIARNRNTLAERITLKAYRDILENVGLIEKGSKNITRDVAMALSELTEMAATRVIFVETNATGKKEVLEYPLLHMGTINRTAGVINGIKIGDWFNVGEYLKLPKEEQKGVTYFIKMVEGLDPGIQLWYIIYKRGKRGDLHIQYKTFAKAVGIEGSLEKNPRRTIPGIEKKVRLCLQAGKNPDLWYIEEKKEYDPKGSLVVKKIKQKTTTQTGGGGR